MLDQHVTATTSPVPHFFLRESPSGVGGTIFDIVRTTRISIHREGGPAVRIEAPVFIPGAATCMTLILPSRLIHRAPPKTTINIIMKSKETDPTSGSKGKPVEECLGLNDKVPFDRKSDKRDGRGERGNRRSLSYGSHRTDETPRNSTAGCGFTASTSCEDA